MLFHFLSVGHVIVSSCYFFLYVIFISFVPGTDYELILLWLYLLYCDDRAVKWKLFQFCHFWVAGGIKWCTVSQARVGWTRQ